MRCGKSKVDVARWLVPVALAFVMPGIPGCPYLLDPACFSHLGDDPRSYPDFETKLAELRAEAESSDCGFMDGFGYFLRAGTCGDAGHRFISKGDGFTSTIFYYHANGNFLALSEYRDFPTLPCGSSRDWPHAVTCGFFETTETICGRDN